MKRKILQTSLLLTGLYLSLINTAHAEDPDISLIGYNEGVTIKALVSNVTTYILNFAGIVATLFIIYGGFVYITSAGNEKRSETAKKILTYAVIGLIVVILARFIVVIVRNSITTVVPK